MQDSSGRHLIPNPFIHKSVTVALKATRTKGQAIVVIVLFVFKLFVCSLLFVCIIKVFQ